jgi:hypothetical protein
MELLYFISGILSVGVLYGIWLLRTVKSSHTDLLARYQSQSNISSIRNSDLEDELEGLKVLVLDIQSNMEKDQYESVSGINKKINEIETIVKGNVDKIGFASGANEKNFTTAFNEIQQLKNNLKALGQDPNMLSRY